MKRCASWSNIVDRRCEREQGHEPQHVFADPEGTFVHSWSDAESRPPPFALPVLVDNLAHCIEERDKAVARAVAICEDLASSEKIPHGERYVLSIAADRIRDTAYVVEEGRVTVRPSRKGGPG